MFWASVSPKSVRSKVQTTAARRQLLTSGVSDFVQALPEFTNVNRRKDFRVDDLVSVNEGPETRNSGFPAFRTDRLL